MAFFSLSAKHDQYCGLIFIVTLKKYVWLANKITYVCQFRSLNAS